MEDVEHQQALKQQKKYALDITREYQLEDDSLETFAEVRRPRLLFETDLST